MYPTEALTPLQKRLTRICLRMNHIVLAILLGGSWPFILIALYRFLGSIQTKKLPVIIQVGLEFVYAFLPFSVFPLGICLIMAIKNYAQVMSAFLPESEPRDIPDGKYKGDLKILAKAGEPIKALNFEEHDRFYLGGALHVLVIIYKHQEEDIYWSTVRLIGKLTFSSLDSDFEHDVGVGTTTASAAGKRPLRPGRYLQIVPAVSPQVFLTIHRDAIALLQESGYVTKSMEETRSECIRSFQRGSVYMRTFPYWPIRITAWTLFRSNFQYRKTLREQVAAGKTTIPSR
jgi:hypothetical protein